MKGEAVFSCASNPFPSPSPSPSRFPRRSAEKRDSPLVGGLTDIFPHSPEDMLSKDGFGNTYAVQYYPHIHHIEPLEGSKAGGTIVTIQGGGEHVREMNLPQSPIPTHFRLASLAAPQALAWTKI